MVGAVSVELVRRSDVEVVSGERSPSGHPLVLSRSCRIRLAASAIAPAPALAPWNEDPALPRPRLGRLNGGVRSWLRPVGENGRSDIGRGPEVFVQAADQGGDL